MTQKKSSKDDEDIKIEEPEIDIKVEDDTAVAEESAPKEPEVKEPPKESEDVLALRQQIDELKNAQRLRDLEAERRQKEAQAQMESMRYSADQSQYDTIVTAIGAAQMEIDSAKRDIVLSGQAQDFAALADAQERLATAKAHLVGLEQGKTAYEQQFQAMQQQQHRPQVPADPLDAMPGLTYEEKDWLRAHPDALSDPKKNARLNAAYFDAMDANLRRGSKEYFELIEEKLGYREKKVEPRVEKVEPAQDENPAMVAAPPSNQVPSGSGTGGKKPVYTLTKEEAEVAKLSGITPQEYVKQRELFRAQKKANSGDYPDR